MQQDKETTCDWLALLAAFEALPIEVAEVQVRGMQLKTANGWERRTTVFEMRGPEGLCGLGEDVTYAAEDHDEVQAGAIDLAGLRGCWSLGALWDRIQAGEWFARAPSEAKALGYRRCALETATLELALAQAGVSMESLAARFGAIASPELAFCVSLSLDGAHFERIEAVLERVPEARFKLDYAAGWNAATLERLVALETSSASSVNTGPRIAVVDFKGFYRGAFRGPEPSAEGYLQVAEALPHALLEDPWLGADDWADAQGGARSAKAHNLAAMRLGGSQPIARALAQHVDRITWDAPLTGLDVLERLDVLPRTINIKPSRFGGVRETLRVLAFAQDKRLALYVGGQFELGPGRDWLQRLARLACPNGPNDCAPTVYNKLELPGALPPSPLGLTHAGS